MNHVKAFALKGIMTLALLSIVMGLGFRLSAESIALTAVLYGAISYGIGDMAFLHKTNNLLTTAVDLALTFVLVFSVVIWFEGLNAGIAASSAFISALMMAVGEYFFHLYIKRNELGSVKQNSV
ncbi:DUF2512 family protein [Rossellomorea sp. LjRoot5]|uniref:DUF2512 family protein n=1 Tax=Rossellomorea sp. LjRoot5 TaxID=3342331 RepID=UPI003ECCEA55